MFFKIIFISFLVVLTLVRIYFKSKYYKLFTKDYLKYEQFYIVFIRIILGLLLLVLLFFMLFKETYIKFSYFKVPLILRLIGIFLSAFGIGLLVWSHLTLKDNFTTTIFLKDNHKLVTNGPYRFLRHPMYISYIIFFTGLTLISENYVFGLLSNGIILSLINLRLPYEEKFLLERFKEYKEYSEKVPRFIPKIRIFKEN